MLEIAHVYFFVFGVFAIAGGVFGFVKAKSMPSLVAGSVSGAALIVAGVLIGTGASTRIGLILGLIVALALAGRFVPAFLKTKKVMPAGLMGALGIIGVIVSALTLVNGS
jgi:uncharacterized membrane protein (UPF0136 family)